MSRDEKDNELDQILDDIEGKGVPLENPPDAYTSEQSQNPLIAKEKESTESTVAVPKKKAV